MIETNLSRTNFYFELLTAMVIDHDDFHDGKRPMNYGLMQIMGIKLHQPPKSVEQYRIWHDIILNLKRFINSSSFKGYFHKNNEGFKKEFLCWVKSRESIKHLYSHIQKL